MGSKHNKGNTVIPTPILPENQKIKFSFEYYDNAATKYCLSSWSEEQIRNALLRLQEICKKSFNELNRERRVYHFGQVLWEHTVEKQGFPNPEINELSPFHFALLGVNGQLTRVFGAYSLGTFYIVWFDLNHEIWPTELKHT